MYLADIKAGGSSGMPPSGVERLGSDLVRCLVKLRLLSMIMHLKGYLHCVAK